jgi:hypothetical protein
MPLHFTKMHGIGNDFVVLDCRRDAFALNTTQIRALGDRHTGVGFDQLLSVEPARDPLVRVLLRHLEQRWFAFGPMRQWCALCGRMAASRRSAGHR